MEGVGFRLKNERLYVFGFFPFYMREFYGMAIICLPLYFNELFVVVVNNIYLSDSDLLLCFDLLN